MVCTERVWFNHILIGHPDMKGQEADVIATIEAPMFGIFADAEILTRQIFYRLNRETSPRYLKVVVTFEGTNGWVITAYSTDRMKAGEQLI